MRRNSKDRNFLLMEAPKMEDGFWVLLSSELLSPKLSSLLWLRRFAKCSKFWQPNKTNERGRRQRESKAKNILSPANLMAY